MLNPDEIPGLYTPMEIGMRDAHRLPPLCEATTLADNHYPPGTQEHRDWVAGFTLERERMCHRDLPRRS